MRRIDAEQGGEEALEFGLGPLLDDMAAFIAERGASG